MGKKKWNLFDWWAKKADEHPKCIERFHKYVRLFYDVLYFGTCAGILYLTFVVVKQTLCP